VSASAWFEVWVEAGPRTRLVRVFGTLAFALLAARSIACEEQVPTELSYAGDIPCIEFDRAGRPRAIEPLVLPLLAPMPPHQGVASRGTGRAA
jgi:hypothetical protein